MMMRWRSLQSSQSGCSRNKRRLLHLFIMFDVDVKIAEAEIIQHRFQNTKLIEESSYTQKNILKITQHAMQYALI